MRVMVLRRTKFFEKDRDGESEIEEQRQIMKERNKK
jgi:hypothetical protein